MRLTVFALVTLLAPSLADAQTPPAAGTAAPPPPPPRWERQAELSLVSTGGNTDTSTLGLSAGVTFRPGRWTTEGRTAFVRAEASNIETARSFVVDVRESYAVTDRFEVFGRYAYLADRFAGIDHRSTVDAGGGYRLLPGPVHTLRVDAGLGYSTESRVVGPDQSFTLAAFGAAYKWQISSGATLTNSAIFTAPFGDADAWRFGNAFGIAASLTRVFTLKLSYDVKVNNDPVPGFEKTDRLTSMAIVAKF